MLGLRQRLRQGIPTTVGFLDLGSAVSAQIAAMSGFDAVVIDLEHGAGDDAAARAQIAAAESEARVIVRTPDGPTQVARMLDFGAAGVLVPRVASAAEAAEAAAAVRYATGRGISALARSTGFGINAADDWRASLDASVACIIQIERASALEDVNSIASIEGVDALLVGPADLSNDLGCDANLDREPLRGAALSVIDAAIRHRKAAGLFLGRGEDPAPWIAQGVTLLSASFESAILLNGSRAVSQRLSAAFSTGSEGQ
jgi:4-hydroxy-2-oxoheptanedioate aldolase